MFSKLPLTRALQYILIKSLSLATGKSYPHDLPHTFLKRLKLQYREIDFKHKISSQNISKTLSSIFFLKLHEHWGRRLEKQAPLSNCGEKTASAGRVQALR